VDVVSEEVLRAKRIRIRIRIEEEEEEEEGISPVNRGKTDEDAVKGCAKRAWIVSEKYRQKKANV